MVVVCIPILGTSNHIVFFPLLCIKLCSLSPFLVEFFFLLLYFLWLRIKIHIFDLGGWWFRHLWTPLLGRIAKNGAMVDVFDCSCVFFATFPRLIPNGPILVPEYSKPPRVVLDWFIEVMHSYSILVLKFSGEISVKQAIHGTPKSSIGFVGSHDPNPAIGVSPWVATTQATACFRRGHRRGRRLS